MALAMWHDGTVVLGSLGLARVRVRDGGNKVAKWKDGNEAKVLTQVWWQGTTTIVGGEGKGGGFR